MINSKSLQSVHNNTFFGLRGVDHLYNLARIPNTIMSKFGYPQDNLLPPDVFQSSNKYYDKIILFVIDAFGYHQYEHLKDHNPFLKWVTESGIVNKLTTQFPSTTTNNITTLQAGLPVSKTGIYEWYFYEPLLDAVYNPLTYRYAWSKEEVKEGYDKLLPFSTFYERLPVKSYIFQLKLFCESPYSKWMSRGSELISYTNYQEGMDKLVDVISKNERCYCYFYVGDFDDACHDNGPDSEIAKKCLEDICVTLDKTVKKIKDNQDVLILITADHGQVPIDPHQTIYLNTTYPEILGHIKRNSSGEYLAPCGSCRDLFIHVYPESLDYVITFLNKKLQDKALVLPTTELINAGLFGDNPSLRLTERLGNIVIIPQDYLTIWWYEENKFNVKHLGMHGGLTDIEMEVPLIVLP